MIRSNKTPEERIRHRNEYCNAYMKRYRKDHPEKVDEWNTRKYINFLRRKGYTVTQETEKGGADK